MVKHVKGTWNKVHRWIARHANTPVKGPGCEKYQSGFEWMLSIEQSDNTDLKIKATHHALLSNGTHQAFFLSAPESVNVR